MRAKKELSGATVRLPFLPDAGVLGDRACCMCLRNEGRGPQERQGHDVRLRRRLYEPHSAGVNCLPGHRIANEGTSAGRPAQVFSLKRKVGGPDPVQGVSTAPPP